MGEDWEAQARKQTQCDGQYWLDDYRTELRWHNLNNAKKELKL